MRGEGNSHSSVKGMTRQRTHTHTHTQQGVDVTQFTGREKRDESGGDGESVCAYIGSKQTFG